MSETTSPEKTTLSLTVDGRVISAEPGELLIAAAERHGVYIPRFCYHPRMTSVGMCRMCLVEVEGPRGSALQVSCMLDAAEGMVVHTESPAVKKAQDGVLEFLLINHPLDCPVCDKGGECPLQDQTMAYGPGESRFVEEKRHFEKPIPISDLVFLDRERCILCDRCTRFASEVAGDPLISFIGPGQRDAGAHVPRCAVRLLLLRQHRADLPGRRAHGQALPLQGTAVGSRAGRVDVHHVLGRLSRHRAVVAQPGAPLPGCRHRPGELGLALRQGPVRVRGDRERPAPVRAARARGRPARRGLVAGGPRAGRDGDPRGTDRRRPRIGRGHRRRAAHQRRRVRVGEAREVGHRHRQRRRADR